MSLWGNADSAAITGTVAVANGDATVTGTSTVFTTAGQIDVGDLMMIVACALFAGFTICLKNRPAVYRKVMDIFPSSLLAQFTYLIDSSPL